MLVRSIRQIVIELSLHSVIYTMKIIVYTSATYFTYICTMIKVRVCNKNNPLVLICYGLRPA